MTGFSVDPADLDGYAVQLAANAEAVREGGRYAARYSRIDWAGAGDVLGLISDVHPRLVDRIDALLAGAVAALTDSAAELHEAAGWYRHTEAGNAARLDASYPAVSRPPADPDPAD